ncbi:MAG TPA: response regulator, partial [Chloroflexota bacterium]|nr:response regulator [Chloroflexota bacterium]
MSIIENPDEAVVSQNQTILMVDDTPANLAVVGDYLTQQGYQVMVSLTGETGLSLAQEAHPDLILLDVLLPGIDGFETCRRLKADEQTRDIPVIFMTIVTRTEDKVRGFEAGGVDYITKPFQHEEVLARVTTHLRIRELTQKLEEAKEGLELRVVERTSALAQANIRLKEEIAERQKTEEEREQLLHQIQQQAKEVQFIVDTVPEGMFLLSKNGRVRLTNGIAEQYLTLLAPGWETEQLTHLGPYPLTDLLTSPPKGLWHDVAMGEQLFEVIARPVENGPTNEGWVFVIRDVTREREIQQHLQAHERLAAVGQLAAGIAHDFNNTLAVIILYTDLLLRTLELPPRAEERLHILEQQAQRASDLIQQILDFSRQSVMERQSLNLLPFLKDLLRLLRRTLPESIDIELDYAQDAYVIHADPSRIQQAIMNLAVNARDAMREGGHLLISLNGVRLEPGALPPVPGMGPGEWIRVSIADSGTGIPAEAVVHIFEPFFTTKERGQGTGLGLAQVYGIVQQHDGFIGVTTEVG